MNTLSIIGRNTNLFKSDMLKVEEELCSKISSSRFLVLGAAGSIGQAVTKEIFKRNPRKLHVVDISENNMVELVRDIRSSFGYINGDFKSFALDIDSIEYDAFIEDDGQFDYVLNLSALKHVRSEKDPYTLMRMIDVNILNTNKTIQQSIEKNVKKYFCVSTDKAANPVNMMGASKKIMEMFLMKKSKEIEISTARFANVAFSDGSLLHGFNQRILKGHPLVAPNDVKRYFVTPQESGELCLISCIFGENRDIFFPKLNEDLHQISFSDIAKRFLKQKGLTPVVCKTELEARSLAKTGIEENLWPCFFSKSDTTGEKNFEEFYTSKELLDMDRYDSFGIIKNRPDYCDEILNFFIDKIEEMKHLKKWNKNQIISLFQKVLPDFIHIETGKNLDEKM